MYSKVNNYPQPSLFSIFNMKVFLSGEGEKE